MDRWTGIGGHGQVYGQVDRDRWARAGVWTGGHRQVYGQVGGDRWAQAGVWTGGQG